VILEGNKMNIISSMTFNSTVHCFLPLQQGLLLFHLELIEMTLQFQKLPSFSLVFFIYLLVELLFSIVLQLFFYQFCILSFSSNTASTVQLSLMFQLFSLLNYDYIMGMGTFASLFLLFQISSVL
jgi:hypothetical protein